MYVIVFVALLSAVCSFAFIMWMASIQSELGLAALVACMTFVPLFAHHVWSGIANDLFNAIWLLVMLVCAAISLCMRYKKKTL